jgi:NADH dehydrogenase
MTLVDKTNRHLFQPLLDQVATPGLAEPAIAAPIRSLFRSQCNLTTLLAEVV